MISFHSLFFMFGFTRNDALKALAERRALAMLSFGFLPVDGFFVLTGLLIARPLLAARASGAAPPSVAALYARRFVRILPTLALCLAVYAHVVFPNGSMHESSVRSEASLELRARFFPTKNWWPHQCEGGRAGLNLLWANAQLPFAGCAAWTWSLSVQGGFYIGFPLLFVAFCWPSSARRGVDDAPSRCVCRCICARGAARGRRYACCVAPSMRSARRRLWSLAVLGIFASTAARGVAWVSLSTTLATPGALKGEAKWKSLFLAFYYYSHTCTRVGALFVGVVVAMLLGDARHRAEARATTASTALRRAAPAASGAPRALRASTTAPRRRGARKPRLSRASKEKEAHTVDCDDSASRSSDVNDEGGDDGGMDGAGTAAGMRRDRRGGAAPSRCWPSDGLGAPAAAVLWVYVAAIFTLQLVWTKLIIPDGAVFETPGWSAAKAGGWHNAAFAVFALVGGPLSAALFGALVVLAALPLRLATGGRHVGAEMRALPLALRITVMYRALLSSPAWRPLSRASFGAYLVHPMVMQWAYAAGRPLAMANGAPPSALRMLLVYAPTMQVLAFGLGWLLHYGVERPVKACCLPHRSGSGDGGGAPRRCVVALAALHATVAALVLIAQHALMTAGVLRAFHGASHAR
jgi:peptidoglycan/LPS O-acetylase OafA/YrhL